MVQITEAITKDGETNHTITVGTQIQIKDGAKTLRIKEWVKAHNKTSVVGVQVPDKTSKKTLGTVTVGEYSLI